MKQQQILHLLLIPWQHNCVLLAVIFFFLLAVILIIVLENTQWNQKQRIVKTSVSMFSSIMVFVSWFLEKGVVTKEKYVTKYIFASILF